MVSGFPGSIRKGGLDPAINCGAVGTNHFTEEPRFGPEADI